MSKNATVTREPQAGFIDHIKYTIDEVNTLSWQNNSYLASMHGNVTKHMNLLEFKMQFGSIPKWRDFLDGLDFSAAPTSHFSLVQQLNTSHNTSW